VKVCSELVSLAEVPVPSSLRCALSTRLSQRAKELQRRARDTLAGPRGFVVSTVQWTELRAVLDSSVQALRDCETSVDPSESSADAKPRRRRPSWNRLLRRQTIDTTHKDRRERVLKAVHASLDSLLNGEGELVGATAPVVACPGSDVKPSIPLALLGKEDRQGANHLSPATRGTRFSSSCNTGGDGYGDSLRANRVYIALWHIFVLLLITLGKSLRCICMCLQEVWLIFVGAALVVEEWLNSRRTLRTVS
jgi:hypothetical protein